MDSEIKDDFIYFIFSLCIFKISTKMYFYKEKTYLMS